MIKLVSIHLDKEVNIHSDVIFVVSKYKLPAEHWQEQSVELPLRS